MTGELTRADELRRLAHELDDGFASEPSRRVVLLREAADDLEELESLRREVGWCRDKDAHGRGANAK